MHPRAAIDLEIQRRELLQCASSRIDIPCRSSRAPIGPSRLHGLPDGFFLAGRERDGHTASLVFLG